MIRKLLTLQYLVDESELCKISAEYRAGFNSFVYGHSWSDMCTQQSSAERLAGYSKAQEWANEGRIYYTYPFPHKGCTSTAFPYGGFWVCNECGKKGLDEPWWAIRVMQDGNAFCCMGENFEDLQASDNYAFGDTRQEAIDNYGKLMLDKAASNAT